MNIVLAELGLIDDGTGGGAAARENLDGAAIGTGGLSASGNHGHGREETDRGEERDAGKRPRDFHGSSLFEIVPVSALSVRYFAGRLGHCPGT